MNNKDKSQQELYRMMEQRAREHLLDFSILTNEKYIPNWHHEIIAKELEKIERGEAEYEILLLFMPPRHGKSEEATKNFPAWYLGRNPDKEIITASYSADLAIEFGGGTRDLINGEVYKSIFDVKLKADDKAKGKWKTQEGGSYTSVGIGGAITGKGANIFIIDDPIKNQEEADSEVIREKHWGWFKSTAYTRLEPKGVMIIILTRWHLDDLAGRILNDEEFKKDIKIIQFPAIATEDEKYRKKGEALWESRYPLEKLKNIKAKQGVYNWASLYQQTPILSENQEFKPEWIKEKDESELNGIQTRNFLTIDTAISEKASADYTGLCDNSVDRENFWNLKAWRMRLNPKQLIDLIFIKHEQRNYEKIGIEKTIYLQAIQPFLEEEMRKRNKFLPIVELHHNQIAKEIRIRGLVPRYESGSVYHLKGECIDLEEEMFTFPKGMNDDILDAVAYQLQIAEAPNKPNEQDYNLYQQSYT